MIGQWTDNTRVAAVFKIEGQSVTINRLTEAARWEEVTKNGATILDAVTQDSLLSALADVRWQAEVGGVEFQGSRIPTDDRSKMLINGAFNQALMQDDPAITRTFKIGGQFVTLTNAEILNMATAIADHVQKCFDAEAIVAEQIATGVLTERSEIKAAFEQALESLGS